MPAPLLEEARDHLRRVWGFDDFRWAQRRVVMAALTGRDALAVLPTGGGKSLCYQVPALSLGGTTVVVSPLISLMQDQVGVLRRRGVAAAYVSSAQRAGEQRAVWAALNEGRLTLLYLAPERLGQLLDRAPGLRIPLLAVDEAHCISEWGHDFRPHYRALGRHRGSLGYPPTIALTGSATPDTRRDILRVLRLRRPVVALNSFDRPNLRFGVRRFPDDRSRLRAAVLLLRRSDAMSIVYVPTRNRTDGVAAVLRRRGIRAAPYHAGLPTADRTTLLEDFLAGRIRVMVATSAFGMGIDAPEVRYVIHLGVPARPEAYYQEAGRAGRDGQPSRCELLWTRADLDVARSLARGAPGVHLSQSPAHRAAQARALRVMQRYVKTLRCRRRVLLEYFGERVGRCGGCDRCGD